MAKLYVRNGIHKLKRTDGSILSLPDFHRVGELCWGFFWFEKRGLYGFMNELGEVIHQAEYLEVGNFDETGHAPIRKETGWAFISTHGYEIGKAIYDQVWWYHNGWAKVQKGGQVTYIDKFGMEPKVGGFTFAERTWNDTTYTYL